MKRDSLGDRMKGQYEDRSRVMLPRRTYTILRADGKAFHTFTRHCQKPHDQRLADAMDAAAVALCEEAQGSCFGYVQSDEISVLLTDFTTIHTDAWFDGNLQKIVSVAASIVTGAFARAWSGDKMPVFDCRAFTIPDPVEVENYFIWRQQDATRNSVSMLAQAHYSHGQLQKKNSADMHDMLHQKGINWNDCSAGQKRGRGIVYTAERGWSVDADAPVFTQDRGYLRSQMAWGLPPADPAVAGTD